MKYSLYQPQAIHEQGQRRNQEDALYPVCGQATAQSRLYIVCDGMGGHENGEVASQLAATALSKYVEPVIAHGEALDDSVLKAAFTEAYDQMDAATPAGSERSMGTTVTLLALHGAGCTAAHLGDSRIYHIRPQTGEILYRSRDHSLVQQLYEMGEISYADMKTSSKKNVVTKALLPHEQRHVPEIMHTTDVQAGDYFLLCSDGLLEQTDDNELVDLLCDPHTDDAAKRARLVSMTANNGDNHSAYLIHVKSVENEETDSQQPNDEAQFRAQNKALNDPELLGVEVSITQSREEEPQEKPSGKKMLWVVVLVAVAVALALVAWWLLAAKPKPAPPPAKPAKVQQEIDFGQYNDDAGSRSSRYKTFDKGQPSTGARQEDKKGREADEILRDAEQRKQRAAEQQEKAVKQTLDKVGGRNGQPSVQQNQPQEETVGTMTVSSSGITIKVDKPRKESLQ